MLHRNRTIAIKLIHNSTLTGLICFLSSKRNIDKMSVAIARLIVRYNEFVIHIDAVSEVTIQYSTSKLNAPTIYLCILSSAIILKKLQNQIFNSEA